MTSTSEDHSSPNPTLRLLIASNNDGKVREFGALLADLGLDIAPMPSTLEVEETGATFAENARLKASTVARASGCWALADDSGLEVLALGGAPGVYSARYAPTDAARIARLLEELAAVEQEAARRGTAPDRRARFVCALALANPQGAVVLEAEGACAGSILQAPRGIGGFGYDPLFWLEVAGQTFAEMDPATKSHLGHRGRAFAALKPALEEQLPVWQGAMQAW